MPLIIPANVPYKLKCTLNKTPVDCSRPVEGTRADVECDDYYTKKSKRYVVPLCHDGTWDEDVDECVPGQLLANLIYVFGVEGFVSGSTPHKCCNTTADLSHDKMFDVR